jgi:hypothetical protein
MAIVLITAAFNYLLTSLVVGVSVYAYFKWLPALQERNRPPNLSI